MSVSRFSIRTLLALPGLIFACFALIGASLTGLDLPFALPLDRLVLASLATYWGAIALVALFEHLRSFRDAGQLLEGTVSRLQLTGSWAFILSVTSAVGEELLFRGFLLLLFEHLFGPTIGVLAQAFVFALLHPAPKRAWAYPFWTFAIGTLFGAITIASGSLLPSMIAHYIFNHQNFNHALEEPEELETTQEV